MIFGDVEFLAPEPLGDVDVHAVDIRVFNSNPPAVPEPTTGLLVIAGLLGLAGWRRVAA